MIEPEDDFIDPKVEKRLIQTANALTPTAKQAERERLAAQMKAFEAAGGKIYYAKPEESHEIPMAVDPGLQRSRERAKQKNRATKGRVTERQRKIMATIRKAMNGAKTITFEAVRKVLKMSPSAILESLRALCRSGYLDFDGTTITARGMV